MRFVAGGKWYGVEEILALRTDVARLRAEVERLTLALKRSTDDFVKPTVDALQTALAEAKQKEALARALADEKCRWFLDRAKRAGERVGVLEERLQEALDHWHQSRVPPGWWGPRAQAALRGEEGE